jgi:hypothetical protein
MTATFQYVISKDPRGAYSLVLGENGYFPSQLFTITDLALSLRFPPNPRTSVREKARLIFCQVALRSTSRTAILRGWHRPSDKSRTEFETMPTLSIFAALKFPRSLVFTPSLDTDLSDHVLEIKVMLREGNHDRVFLAGSVLIQAGSAEVSLTLTHLVIALSTLNTLLMDPCTVSFSYCWPALIVPLLPVRNKLEILGVFGERTPLVDDALPSIILNHFTRTALPAFFPSQIAARRRLLGWIQAVFIPEVPITSAYLALLSSSVVEFGPWPDPFFTLLVKCILLAPHFELTELDSFLTPLTAVNSLALAHAVA